MKGIHRFGPIEGMPYLLGALKCVIITGHVCHYSSFIGFYHINHFCGINSSESVPKFNSISDKILIFSNLMIDLKLI